MAPAASPPTMLVIDDEPQIRRVVRHALEADHARVLEAASGREGLDLAAAERRRWERTRAWNSSVLNGLVT